MIVPPQAAIPVRMQFLLINAVDALPISISFASFLSSATTEYDKGSIIHPDRHIGLSSGIYLMS